MDKERLAIRLTLEGMAPFFRREWLRSHPSATRAESAKVLGTSIGTITSMRRRSRNIVLERCRIRDMLRRLPKAIEAELQK